jgi:hypothetical protein
MKLTGRVYAATTIVVGPSVRLERSSLFTTVALLFCMDGANLSGRMTLSNRCGLQNILFVASKGFREYPAPTPLFLQLASLKLESPVTGPPGGINPCCGSAGTRTKASLAMGSNVQGLGAAEPFQMWTSGLKTITPWPNSVSLIRRKHHSDDKFVNPFRAKICSSCTLLCCSDLPPLSGPLALDL